MSVAKVSTDTFSEQATGSLQVSLAETRQEIEESLRLRYQVFCTEMGANLQPQDGGLETDEFDRHCLHLLVRDTGSGQVVGSTRLLLDRAIPDAGMFYSETEFDLHPILSLSGRFMEVGRTCIHAEYRTGAAIRTLWNGIAQQVIQHDIDYLIGCASLPMGSDGAHAHAIIDRIRDRYFTPDALRAQPRLPLPEATLPANTSVVLPALLKAYLRLGAKVAGEACWDPVFNVADLFILLDRERLAPRYARTFIDCA